MDLEPGKPKNIALTTAHVASVQARKWKGKQVQMEGEKHRSALTLQQAALGVKVPERERQRQPPLKGFAHLPALSQ